MEVTYSLTFDSKTVWIKGFLPKSLSEGRDFPTYSFEVPYGKGKGIDNLQEAIEEAKEMVCNEFKIKKSQMVQTGDSLS